MMDTKNKKQEDLELDKVVDLITPHHPRQCVCTFVVPRKQVKNKNWIAGGIAAMVAIVVSIAIYSVMPISATEVVNSALAAITGAETVKSEFVFPCVKRTSGEEIYKPAIDGERIEGTFYLMRKDNDIFVRVDWHDKERNSIVLKDGNYIHLQNNIIKNKFPWQSSLGKELLEFMSVKSFPKSFVDGADFSYQGEKIIVTSQKGEVTLRGEFLRDSKQLVKASAIVEISEGVNLSIFETRVIQTNVDRTMICNLFDY